MRLLRYRFDSVEQVSRHFHVASGRVLLFYPSLLSLLPGEPVRLEVSFLTSDQHCPVRGTVVCKETGGKYLGWWLEFPAANLVGSLKSASAVPRRRQWRFPTDVVVNVQRPAGMPVVARLVDIGQGGGRITGVGMRMTAGEKIRVSLFSRATGATIEAQVAWARPPEIGLEFNKPSAAERTAIFALTEDARQAVIASYEATHPVSCSCVNGNAVAEPPLPRIAHRQTAST